jgi:hypothetical protein
MTLAVFDIPSSVPDLTKRMVQMIEDIEPAAKLWSVISDDRIDRSCWIR